ncbi:MAG: hypothetical protein ACT4QC_10160 [Planctomycetaceae bacterium]
MSINDAPPPPVLRETAYEKVSSWLMALLAALAATTAVLAAAWFANRAPAKFTAVPVELIESPGGVDDGAVDETLRVESPADSIPDASPADVVSDEREVQEALDNVLELADQAAEQAERQFDAGTQNTGKVGSASGTGRRALGSGTGAGGFPREQRWLVRFGDLQSVEEYARQLDFFGIELGALAGGKLSYSSGLSQARPTVRTATSGAGEKRLYMTWQAGNRKQADVQLLRKAGVEVGAGTIFHFYPKETEDRLAHLELNYRNRRANEIRRTYFAVKRGASGYDFEVIRQTYLK